MQGNEGGEGPGMVELIWEAEGWGLFGSRKGPRQGLGDERRGTATPTGQRSPMGATPVMDAAWNLDARGRQRKKNKKKTVRDVRKVYPGSPEHSRRWFSGEF
jgi:hypothetical protein